MTVADDQQQDPLDVLACDFRARPRGAPGVFDVLPAVRRIERTGDGLSVYFIPDQADTVAAYADAERLCCADITWDLVREPDLRLRIRAKPAQLDVLEAMFTNQ